MSESHVHILAVECYARFVKMLAERLKGYGYSLLETDNQVDALNLVKARQVDVFIAEL